MALLSQLLRKLDFESVSVVCDIRREYILLSLMLMLLSVPLSSCTHGLTWSLNLEI